LFTPEDDLDRSKKLLEKENRQWLTRGRRTGQSRRFSGEIDPWRIHAELKQLVEKRARWTPCSGHVAMLFKQSRAWTPR